MHHFSCTFYLTLFILLLVLIIGLLQAQTTMSAVHGKWGRWDPRLLRTGGRGSVRRIFSHGASEPRGSLPGNQKDPERDDLPAPTLEWARIDENQGSWADEMEEDMHAFGIKIPEPPFRTHPPNHDESRR